MMKKGLILVSCLAALISCATTGKGESKIYREFARNEFLESIVSAPDGIVYTTNIFEGIIYKVEKDEVATLVDYEGTLVGIAPFEKDFLVATGSNGKMVPVVLLVDRRSGNIAKEVPVAEALLLNGVTVLECLRSDPRHEQRYQNNG